MHEPLFILEQPQLHRLQPGAKTTVRGVALALEGPRVEAVAVYDGADLLATAAVSLPSPELAGLRVAGAADCRFACEVRLDAGREYQLRSVTADGRSSPLFAIRTAAANLARHAALARAVAGFPVPPPSLVFTTQGGEDTESYADSLVSGFFSLTELLTNAGHDPAAVDSVLDIGCGTGRLLLGWHADRPARRLCGVDINETLIDWNRSALRDAAQWQRCDVAPPLPFDGGTFDVVQLASVFTHLPRQHQQSWTAEIRRLLKPDGVAVISLHGELYAQLLLPPELQEEFARHGYVEVAAAEPGANAFSTFHSMAAAESLFRDFRSLRRFPRGADRTPPTVPGIAALQDVYVLRA